MDLSELDLIKSKLGVFLTKWTSHNNHLEAGFEIPYNRFIVIGINQNINSASGCSIDSCVRFIKSLEIEFEISLLDKLNVTYRQGEYIEYKPLKDFKNMVKNRSVSKKTIVFNNLVETKQSYISDWEVSLSESWHRRFL
jgi:hypothetical protein